MGVSHVSINMYVHVYPYVTTLHYKVATISMLLKNIGLFCSI